MTPGNLSDLEPPQRTGPGPATLVANVFQRGDRSDYERNNLQHPRDYS